MAPQPFERLLNSRYHTQDGDDFCGAAVMHVILRHLGVGDEELDQNFLQSILRLLTNKIGIATSPIALSFALNNKALRPNFFALQPSSFEEHNRRIIDSIVAHRIPIAVTINDYAHWVVVEGIQTNIDPRGQDKYLLRGVWIHNPVGNGDGPPPPHSDNDECGSGNSNRGVLKEFITAQQWHLHITATCLSPFKELRLACVLGAGPATISTPAIEKCNEGILCIYDDEKIKAIANATLDDYDLRKHLPSYKLLKPGQPKLIHGPLNQGGDYYLVPWCDDEGSYAFSRINKQSGYLMSVMFTGKPVRGFPLPHGSVLISLLEGLSAKFNFFGISKNFGTRMARFFENFLRQKVNSSKLVWKPSLQSLSPYYPFYKIEIFPGKFIYVDQSGALHSELTDPIPGG